jgi:hypothetical protein
VETIGYRDWVAAIVTGAMLVAPSQARAQKIELSPLEVSIGATINTLFTDVNSIPHCVRLALPCTHGQPDRFSGFGLNLGIARSVGTHLAIAGEVSAFRADWDVLDSERRVGRASTHVTSFLVGPRASTQFLFYRPSHGRFFFHALVGAERSSVAGFRPTVVIGTGADGGLFGSSRHLRGPSRPLFLRWSVDYRISSGSGRSFSGFRFAVSLMFGPRLIAATRTSCPSWASAVITWAT